MKTIRRGEILRLVHPQAAHIEVREGCLWITQDGDREDYIVRAGESFRAWRPGATVISALKAAILEITPAATPA